MRYRESQKVLQDNPTQAMVTLNPSTADSHSHGRDMARTVGDPFTELTSIGAPAESQPSPVRIRNDGRDLSMSPSTILECFGALGLRGIAG